MWSDMVWYGVVCSLAKMKNDCVNYGNVKLNGIEAKILCSSRIRRKRYTKCSLFQQKKHHSYCILFLSAVLYLYFVS